MRARFDRQRGACTLTVALLLSACGAGTSAGPAPASPHSYPGRCSLAGIEEVPAPAGQDQDAVVMVARYQPSSGTPVAPKAWGLRFQVQRAREHDLRLHIQAHPNVLCDVEREGEATSARIDLPPFQGQSGTPEPQ